MVSVSFGAISVMVMVFLTMALPVVLVWSIYKVFQLVSWIVRNIFRLVRGLVGRVVRFVRGTLVDVLHAIGGILTAGVITPLALVNVAIGRWSSAAHYGRAIEDELTSAAGCMYRVALGHPIRLLGLSALTDGVERRLPDLVARAPQPERRRSKGKISFEGYQVVGNLPTGGSGAKLYLARPSASKLSRFKAKGFPDPGQVVVKSFALEEGSTLPQIVRESRALEAANRLGLVLDHELSPRSFHYVMPYVPGDDLDVVIRKLHAESSDEGLAPEQLSKVVGYSEDLLATLEQFHDGGLWHKDIKPTNLIVSEDRVHLVDLGLVTPLESAMTLTTHGTEYFRDPELVRLALKGVKVHEVDGVKFDIYSAGAVLYSMIENSFPAHGNLSRLTKSCPDALQWIVRRAMADLNSRYASAAEMLADLRVLRAAPDPYAVRPADLPSVGGAPESFAEGASEAGTPPFASAPPIASAASFQPANANVGPRPFVAAPSRRQTVPSTRAARIHRRIRRGVMAAGFFAMFFGIFAGFGAQLLEGRGRPNRIGRLIENVNDRARDVASRIGIHEERRTPTRHQLAGQQVQDMWARRLSPDLPDYSRVRHAGKQRTVLVLGDLSPACDERIEDGLGAYLERRGYQVVGLGDCTNRELRERSISWIAAARKAVGLSDPTDAQALARLQRFLDASSKELTAVLWLTQAGNTESVLYHLVSRSPDEMAVPEEIVFSRQF